MPVAFFNDFSFGPHCHATFAGCISALDRGPVINEAAGGEVRPLHEFHKVFAGEFSVINQSHGCIHDFPQVMRRDIRRHTDGDAQRAVEEQVGEFCRQDFWFEFGGVIVVHPIHRVFVDVRNELERHRRQPALGIPHCGGGVAIERAEVALPVNQRVAHGKILG